jgi:pimeloyl-ACP methyl ester carboxylesterase
LQRGIEKVFDEIPRVNAPVLVVRAQEPELNFEEYNMAWSPTWTGLTELFPNGREIHFPEATHFIPLEDPELVAELISEALG